MTADMKPVAVWAWRQVDKAKWAMRTDGKGKSLLDDPTQFVQTLTEKLMIYALGRSVEYYDMPAVRHIVHDAGRQNYRFSAILAGIANSEPFRYSTAPAAAEDEPITAQAAGAGVSVSAEPKP